MLVAFNLPMCSRFCEIYALAKGTPCVLDLRRTRPSSSRWSWHGSDSTRKILVQPVCGMVFSVTAAGTALRNITLFCLPLKWSEVFVVDYISTV